MGKSEDGRYYMVRGSWDPSSRGFKELTHLNEETPKGTRDEDPIAFQGKLCPFLLSLAHACASFGFVFAWP